MLRLLRLLFEGGVYFVQELWFVTWLEDDVENKEKALIECISQ